MIRSTSPDPDGSGSQLPVVSESTFDIRGNVVESRVFLSPADARISNFDYDSLGRLWRSRAPAVTVAGHSLRPESIAIFDLAGRVVESRERVDASTFRSVFTTYDDLGRIHQVVAPDPDGNGPQAAPVSTTWHNAAGQPRYARNPNGHLIEQTYDSLGQPYQIWAYDPEAAGGKVLLQTAAWQVSGHLRSVADPSGTTTTDYDSSGRVARVTSPAADGRQSEAKTSYDKRGLVKGTSHTGQADVIYQLDPLGRTTRTYTASATLATFTYNAFGEVLTQTDGYGRGLRHAYDLAGREVYREALNNGAPPTDAEKLTTLYDTLGNVLSQTDGLNHTTSYAYDQLFRVLAVQDANGQLTQMSYDLLGRQTGVLDPDGNITSFAYDLLDRTLAESIVIAGQTLTRGFGYDPAGNLVLYVDRNGRATTYGYDARERRRSEKWYENVVSAGVGTNPLNTISYGFDDSNRLEFVSDAFASYQYAYDDRDRLRSVETAIAGHEIILGNFYDRPDDPRTRLQIAIDGAIDTVTSFKYDGLQRLSAIEQQGAGSSLFVAPKRATFSYNDNSQFTAIARFAGIEAGLGDPPAVFSTQFDYDGQSRLAFLSHYRGAQNLADYVYQYDDAGRLDSIDSPQGHVEYGYDPADQLTGADYSSSQSDESYNYTPNGNRATYTIDAYNRVASDGEYSYQYDSEGNRTRRTSLSSGLWDEYVWDHRNRLTAVIHHAANSDVISQVGYTYDPFDRRIGRAIDANGDADIDSSQAFVYDGAQIALVFADADGAGPTASTLTNRYLWGPAIDQLLADEQLAATGASSTLLWPAADHLGSIRDLIEYNPSTDSAAIVDHRDYSSFGEIISDSNSARDTLFAYTGREWDPASDLYYYRARWYDPRLAQFLSEDPIGFAAGDPNPRRYVSNSPTDHTDPSGLEEFPGHHTVRIGSDSRGTVYFDFAIPPHKQDWTLVQFFKGMVGANQKPKSMPLGYVVSDAGSNTLATGVQNTTNPASINDRQGYAKQVMLFDEFGGVEVPLYELQGAADRAGILDATFVSERVNKFFVKKVIQATRSGAFHSDDPGADMAAGAAGFLFDTSASLAVDSSLLLRPFQRVEYAIAGSDHLGQLQEGIKLELHRQVASNPNSRLVHRGEIGAMATLELTTLFADPALHTNDEIWYVRGSSPLVRSSRFPGQPTLGANAHVTATVPASTQTTLNAAAARARTAVGAGSGPVHGTKVHTAFEVEVRALGRGNLQTEVSYLNGQVVPRGTRGSVRLDVVEGPLTAPTAVYDLKTGGAMLTDARIKQIQQHVPGGANVPVREVR